MRTYNTNRHTFSFDFPVEAMDNYSITYTQNDTEIIKKKKGDDGLKEYEKEITVGFSTNETALFSPGSAWVQVKAKIGNDIISSQPVRIPIMETWDAVDLEEVKHG